MWGGHRNCALDMGPDRPTERDTFGDVGWPVVMNREFVVQLCKNMYVIKMASRIVTQVGLENHVLERCVSAHNRGTCGACLSFKALGVCGQKH